MKTFKNIFVITFFVSFISLFYGCSPNSKIAVRNKRAKESKNDILIGAAGPWKLLKKENDLQAEGITLAVNEINASGGVLGRQIKVIWKDDEGTIQKGKIVALELCENPDLVAVIGHVNSSVSISTSVLYSHYGVVMLSPLATTPSLTTRSKSKLIFRSIATDYMFAKRLADYAINTGFKNKAFIDSVVIYNEDDIYGNVLAKAFANLISRFAIQTVARRVYGMDSDNVFFKNDLKYVEKLFNFDALFIAGLNKQAIMIIDEASKLGSDVQIFCSQSIEGDDLIEQAGNAAEGVVYCSTYDPYEKTEKNKKFRANFKKAFGKYPEDDAVQGYDAVYVLAEAIKKAGSSAPSDIAKALHEVNYNGIVGNISFDKNGDMEESHIVLMKIEDSKVKVIKNINSNDFSKDPRNNKKLWFK